MLSRSSLLRFFSVLLCAVFCHAGCAQRTPIECASNRNLSVVLARQFIETDAYAIAYITLFAHGEQILISGSIAKPKCTSVSANADGFALIYHFDSFGPHGSDLQISFDLKGNFVGVVKTKIEAATDPDRYKAAQLLIDKGTDAFIDHEKKEVTNSEFQRQIFDLSISILKRTEPWNKATAASTLLNQFLGVLAQSNTYGFPPEEAIEQKIPYVSRVGFSFLEVSPPQAAAMIRGAELDLRDEMQQQREEQRKNRPNSSFSYDGLVSPDSMYEMIHVLDVNADQVPEQTRDEHFVIARLPTTYKASDGDASAQKAYLMKLSNGRFGLVPIGTFDPARKNGVRVADLHPSIERDSARQLVHVGPEGFKIALAQHFQEVAAAANVNASQYEQEMDYLANVVNDCASLPSAFRAAAQPKADPGPPSRREPWNLVDPKYLRECAGSGYTSIPSELVKPVSQQKPRRLVYLIGKGGSLWENSDAFTIGILFTELPSDITLGTDRSLITRYGIMTAQIPTLKTIISIPPVAAIPVSPALVGTKARPLLSSEQQRLRVAEVTVDTATSQMWTLHDNGDDVGWKHAKDYCHKLEIGGFSDWRLPRIEELSKLYDPQSEKLVSRLNSVVKFTQYYIADDITLTAPNVWSSTPGASKDSHYGLFYYDRRAFEAPDNSNKNLRSLCVRD